MFWIKGVLLVLGLLALAGIGLAFYGASRWTQNTRVLQLRLESARVPTAPMRYSEQELDSLPPPVQRYFRAALEDGQRIVAAVSVEHAGGFNMSGTGEQWKPFTSTQRVVTRRPGFVWDGRVAMMPGVPVRVHDAYIAGEGILHPAILGVFTLIDLRGGGEVARGEFMRYVAEAAWYPTALLPSQGVRWQAVDERSATAAMADGPIVLTLLFRFNGEDMIESVLAQARGRTVGDSVIMTPWEGRWSNYQVRDGMRVPLSGEVAWLTPQGRKPYWRGTITSLRYDYAD